jgi:hypothetical protein
MAADFADVPLFSELSYQDLVIGQRFGPFTESLDQALSDELRGPIGTSTPGDFAPLGVLPLVTLRVLRRAMNGIVAGGVLARQTFSPLDVIPAGAELTADVWVTAQKQRRSGFYTTFTFVLSHDGLPRAVVEWMIIAPKDDA